MEGMEKQAISSYLTVAIIIVLYLHVCISFMYVTINTKKKRTRKSIWKYREREGGKKEKGEMM